MKKLISIALVLTMVLSFASVGIFADEAVEESTPVPAGPIYAIPDGATTVDIDTDGDGTPETYTVIKSLEALSKLGNYILMSNINMQITETFDIAEGVVLEGNGFSITDVNVGAGGMFNFPIGSVTIRNLTVGSLEYPAKAKNALFMDAQNVAVNATFVNVDVYAKLTATEDANMGVFFPRPQGQIEFIDCDVYYTYGESHSIMANAVGGYIGRCDANVTFTNCTMHGDMISGKNMSAWVGKLDNGFTLTLSNCTSYANVTANTGGTSGNGVGSVVGMNQGQLLVDNFTNYGNITTKSLSPVGGFVGINDEVYSLIETDGYVNITNSVNYGTIIAAYSSASIGGFIGHNKARFYYKNVTNLGEIVAEEYNPHVGEYYGNSDAGHIFREQSLEISNYDQLVSALSVGQDVGEVFKLVADIDFAGKTVNAGMLYLGAGATFDGNGYKFLNLTITQNGDTDGIFDIEANSDRITTIKNLTIGTAQVPAVASDAIIEGSATNQDDSFTLFENVTIYGTLTSSTYAGLFLSYPGGNHTFRNCTAVATINATAGAGAFIGRSEATLTFVDCTVSGTVAGGNVGAFVGKQNDIGSVTFKNVISNATIEGVGASGNGAGGLVGLTQAPIDVIRATVACMPEASYDYGSIVGVMLANVTYSGALLPEGAIAGAIYSDATIEDVTAVIPEISSDLMVKPQLGETLEWYPNIPEGAGYVAGEIQWVDGEGRYAYYTKPNYTYTGTVTLTVLDGGVGSVFKDGETRLPAGYTWTVSEDGKTAVVTYSFSTEVISSIPSDLIVKPDLGGTLETLANVPDGAGYTASDITWVDSKGNVAYYTKKDETYTGTVTLTVVGGSIAPSFQQGQTTLSKGYTWVVAPDGMSAVVKFTFSTKIVKAIQENLMVVPGIGGYLNPYVYVETGAEYTAGTISWVDEDGWYAYYVESDKTYTGTVTLNSLGNGTGAFFKDGETYLPDGYTWVVSADGTSAVVTYTFTIAAIETVPADLMVQPELGGIFETIPNLPENADYTAGVITWTDEQGNPVIGVKPNTNYIGTVTLTAVDDGRMISFKAQGAILPDGYTWEITQDGKTAVVTYIFTYAIIESIPEDLISCPEAGATLQTEANVPENAGYTSSEIVWVDGNGETVSQANPGTTYVGTVTLTVIDGEDASLFSKNYTALPQGYACIVAPDGRSAVIFFTFTTEPEQQGGDTTTPPAQTDPTPDATTPTAPVEEESGCKSVVGGLSIVLLVAGAAAMVIRKKED